MNSNVNRKLEINELIHQIVFLVINRADYISAVQILMNNSITIEEISQNTSKLTTFHIDTLNDNLILLKNKKGKNVS